MRVLIAFDKFKDALTAREACRVAAETLTASQANWEIDTAPLADGGDGFCDTLTGFIDGEFHTAQVAGPMGQAVEARFGIVSKISLQESAQSLLDFRESTQKIGIIEMAECSGIALTPIHGRSPWTTTSAGLGDLIAAVIETGAQGAIVGLGGSATHDLALGALERLGVSFLDSNGDPLLGSPTPDRWAKIHRIDVSRSTLPSDFEIRLACDVENPLLGSSGAAAVFAPQKGLTPERFEELEALTRRIADLLCEACGIDPKSMDTPGAGAAGGAAFGLQTALGARIVSGYELVKTWIGLRPKFEKAQCVVTGEGRFDASSLHGKGPGALALETAQTDKRLLVLAGSLGEIENAPFPKDCLVAISPLDMPLETALKATRENLAQALLATLGKSS